MIEWITFCITLAAFIVALIQFWFKVTGRLEEYRLRTQKEFEDHKTCVLIELEKHQNLLNQNKQEIDDMQNLLEKNINHLQISQKEVISEIKVLQETIRKENREDHHQIYTQLNELTVKVNVLNQKII